MKSVKRYSVVAVILVVLLSLLTACGSTPGPTSTPTSPPLPTGTQRPTFTPTAPIKATRPSTPTAVPTKTPVAEETETPEALPTPPEDTPTATVTRVTGAAPKLSGTLLFPAFDTAAQTYHIYRMDLSTGQMDKLIEQASQPAVSWDGARIAWRSWNPEQRGLLSRPMDETDIWQMIPFNEAARPDWAPDNERLVFPSRQEPDRESRLYLFTGIGDEPFVEIQRHGSPVIGRTPAFLPDDRIVYQGCVENDCGLFVMGADGANPQRLTNYKDDTTPAVSPDGQSIVYMSKSSGYWQVNIVNVDGTGQRRLTDDWYWNGLPVWSPDGRYILFFSTRDENWPDTLAPSDNTEFRLWVMEADGSNQQMFDEMTLRLDGVPVGVAEHEAWGWIEERLIWLSE
jgi:Tol biopolymer transport system component